MRSLPVAWLLVACDPSQAPIDYVAVEEACQHTAGALIERPCCEGVLDYPATCGPDPCTCAPEQSWDVLYCDCGFGNCFDGNACVHIEDGSP